MTTPTKTVNDPMEMLNRIRGYADSAKRSLKKGNVKAARMSVGFIKAHTERFDELTK